MAARAHPKRKPRFTPVHPHAAGIDIGARFHVAAVAPDRDDEPVRTFRSFTHDLHQLADWLKRVGITTVAMESTGVYWIPLYEILEARGLEVFLVNARDAKNVPGRKTDVNWTESRSRPNGCSNCISMGYCGPVSVRRRRSSPCAPTCGNASACSTTPRPTSSTCKRPWIR